MSYTPPDSHNVVFEFSGEAYTPPDLNNVVFNFGETSNTSQYVTLTGFESLIIGSVKVIPAISGIFPLGFDSFAYGGQKVIQSRFINPTGFNTLNIGTAILKNKNQNINPTGFNALNNGLTKIFNLRQYLSLLTPSRGFNAALYGNAYAQGGVKYINIAGFNAAILPSPLVINTKANQYANLNAPSRGITPPVFTSPNVSPRIIYPSGILAWNFGVPLVQRNPSPKGFINTGYGIAWVSHSPRYIMPADVAAFVPGYPKVFDPTQRVYLADRGFSGGIFGDIAIRNTRRLVLVSSLNSQEFGDWAVVESNLRSVFSIGFETKSIGEQSIRNKTPSIAPIGFDALQGLKPAIGYRIRTIKPSGFYQPKFGTHKLTKPPEIKPSGINKSTFGLTWVSQKTRSIYAGLWRESLIVGGVTVWHYSRKLNPSGIKTDAYGLLRVEHGRRLLLAQGSNQELHGNNTWVSFAQRIVQPTAIVYPNMPIHRVGGTQSINPLGYIATLFGSRITPENQSIYSQGFSNPFGLTVVDLFKKYIKPNGFLTTGQEAGHRFGTAKFWNLRQYIIQFYDVDSGLVPPKWTGWTNIENKNKSIAAIGNNFARIGELNIENKARLVVPNGLNALTLGRAMIADRVRYLKLQGLEAPYISSWSVIYNAAPVIAQKGFKVDVFGVATILNTRRYFNRIGNFESLEVGKPMVADRIRTLKFEQRYTISPPYIPIHHIDLHTRYIDEVGRFDDHQIFGNPSLSIHWNIVTPRWALRDAYGTPVVKNLTPELGTRGRNSEEFGQSSIRTQWRELLHLGSETFVWGRSEIAFRDRQFSVSGFTQWVIPRHTVTKTGVPPYYPQYIWLDSVEIDGKQNNGHGIEIPERQVSFPSVKSNVIFPNGFVASSYGSHYTQSNGILVQPGLQELTIGNHFIGLKNRTITVPTIGDLMAFSKPRLSPHTIYAVMEATRQAIENHPPMSLHYVNSSGGDRKPGEIFGRTIISLKQRKFSAGLGNQSSFNNGHKIQLKKRYINLSDFGFRSQRIGFHVVGPFDQNVTQFDSNDMQSFGKPSLSIPYGGSFFIKPNGLTSPAFNKPVIDFFNRMIKAVGSNHLQMGTWKSGDKPYMWQGLRVGELIKGNYGGFENEAFGNTFISLKVRNVEVQSFESFVMEYDYTQFDKRMRVVRQDLPKPKLFIKPVGFDALFVAVPNIKPAVHYIRPDGNADQFRKGAF